MFTIIVAPTLIPITHIFIFVSYTDVVIVVVFDIVPSIINDDDSLSPPQFNTDLLAVAKYVKITLSSPNRQIYLPS